MPHYKRTTQAERTHASTGSVAEPHRPTVMGGTGYTCPELQPDPSVLPERMTASKLPSRVGERLYWPDGRITDLDHNEVHA